MSLRTLAAVALPLAAAALLVAACSGGGSTAPSAADAGASCPILFGNPNAHTGLGPDQCRPECDCGGTVFAPPVYDAPFIAALVKDWTLSTPYPELAADPYAAGTTPPVDPDGTVCAVAPLADAGASPRPYALRTYPSEAEATAAGARTTHFGSCGACSTLGNLAVYMRENDLTAPVRDCGVKGITSGMKANVACLQALGFDLPCAQAWYYDELNTRSQCLSVCLADLNAPYQLPDGSLNACIQCDEDRSGPVFKAVAGRTRRNSGLPNALCRPCSEVKPLVHTY